MTKLQSNELFHNRYKLIELKGVGGFAEVWKAEDQLTKKVVAVKIYAPDKGLPQDGLQTFSEEYSQLMDLNHTHLLKASHFDVYEGSPYLVMPYCPGNAISRIGKVTENDIAIFISQIASGLAYLHSKSIVHQDIKPNNVLINSENEYVLSDFGISTKLRSTLRKSIRQEEAVKPQFDTMDYAAPERFSKNPKDKEPVKANDIFSFGITIYEMITGQMPFQEGMWTGMLIWNDGEVPDLPERFADNKLISTSFNDIFRDCLAKETWNRPTADELKKAADNFLQTSKWTYKPKTDKTKKTVIKPPVLTEETPKKDVGKTTTLMGGVIKEENNYESRYDRNEIPVNRRTTGNIISRNKKAILLTISSVAIVFALYFAYQYWAKDPVYYPMTVFNKSGYIDEKGELKIDYRYDNVYKFSEGMGRIEMYSLYSFVDLKGNLIADIEFEEAEDFKDGLALVKKNGKYGYIDKKGALVIDYQWYHAQSFSEGLAAVMQNGKYGYIDKSGTLVILCQFESTERFSNDRALVSKNGLYGYIDNKGNVSIAYQYSTAETFTDELALVSKDGRYGYINEKAEETIPFQFIMARPFSEGFAIVEENGKKGAINTSGKKIIECKYDELANFSENGNTIAGLKGKYIVVNSSGMEISEWFEEIDNTYYNFYKVKRNNQYAWIDKEGKKITEFYDDIRFWCNGLARFQKNRLWGFIDVTGKEVISPTYWEVQPYFHNISLVYINGKYHYIKTDGQKLNEDEYDEVIAYSPEGIISVQKNGKWGFIDDKTGKKILAYDYQDALIFVNGLCSVKKDGKWGMIDKTGAVKLNFEYEKLSVMYDYLNIAVITKDDKVAICSKDLKISKDFNKLSRADNINVLIVKNSDKYALSDMNGKLLSEYKFSEIGEDFYSGYSLVQIDDKYNFIDRDGKLISNSNFDNASKFQEGFARVYKNPTDQIYGTGLYGFINVKGELVIDYQYTDAENFSNGLAKVKKDGKYAYIFPDGKLLSEWFDGLNDFNENVCIANRGDSYGFIGKSGKLITGFEFKSANNFSEGYARVIKQDKYGYIDKTGKIIIECKYDYARDFKNGFAVIKNNGMYGYIDKKNVDIIKSQYSETNDFYTWYSKIYNNSKYALIDKAGNLLTDWFESIEVLSSEGIIKVNKDYKYALANFEGKTISDYFEVIDDFSEGFAAVKSNDLYGYINPKGELVIKTQFASAGKFSNGIAEVTNNSKETYIDKTGSNIASDWFQDVSTFENCLTTVKNNDKYAFMDVTGKIVSDWFDNISSTSEGLSYAKKDGKYGYIDKTGKKMIDFVYDDANTFSNGLAKVSQNNKYCMIDNTGSIKTQWYDDMGSFSNGFAAVKQNGKYGFINLDGATIVSCQYEEVGSYSSDGYAYVYNNQKYNVINKKGSNVLPWFTLSQYRWYYETDNSTYICPLYSWQRKGTTGTLMSVPYECNSNCQLSFDWSHKYLPNYPLDRMQVYVSNDKGESWSMIWDKAQSNFDSHDNAETKIAGSYRNEKISLNKTGNLIVKIVGISGYGAFIFVKNVEIDSIELVLLAI